MIYYMYTQLLSFEKVEQGLSHPFCTFIPMAVLEAKMVPGFIWHGLGVVSEWHEWHRRGSVSALDDSWCLPKVVTRRVPGTKSVSASSCRCTTRRRSL